MTPTIAAGSGASPVAEPETADLDNQRYNDC